MKDKRVLQIISIVGIIGGILLIFAVFFLAGSVIFFRFGMALMFSYIFFLLKIIILLSGLTGFFYYNRDTRVGVAPTVLLIVGGGIAMLPFLGWLGGVLSLLGGIIGTFKLNRFN